MKDGLIVAKFGGTSMKDAEAMRRSAKIIKDRPESRLVVVSATSGTTNELVTLGKWALEKELELIEGQVETIRQRHLKIAQEFKMDQKGLKELEELCLEIKVLCTTVMKEVYQENQQFLKHKDRLMSLGERLSSHLFVWALKEQGLKAHLFDAREVIETNAAFGSARPSMHDLQKNHDRVLKPLLGKADHYYVTQGFIGRTPNGQTTTLGRGGSDYSAALFAEVCLANRVDIWTDVPGILTTDPRVVKEAKVIGEMSFDEAAELANFGAKVLHPATLLPAMRKKIPVFVGSSFDPHLPGTIIRETVHNPPVFRALAQRKNQKLLVVKSLEMVGTHGFLAKLFTMLARHEVSVDLVTTSEVTVALTLDGNNNGSGGEISLPDELLKELREFAEVTIESDLTLVALIGNELGHTKGLSSKIFGAIESHNIRMICHGSSPHNICFLVHTDDSETILKALHQEFLGGRP